MTQKKTIYVSVKVTRKNYLLIVESLMHIMPVSNWHDARLKSGTREIVLGYLLGNLVRATYVKVLFK